MQVRQLPSRSKTTPSAKSKSRRYGSYIVTRGSSLYFRYVVPITLRPLLGLTEIRRSMKGRGLRDVRPVAQVVGSQLKILFEAATKTLREGNVIDRDELSKILHRALDFELTRLEIDISSQLASQARSDSPLIKLRLLDRSDEKRYIPQSNCDFSINLGFLRAIYEEPSNVAQILVKETKEALGDIDKISLDNLLYGELPLIHPNEWQKKALYFTQEVNKALDVAKYHIGMRLYDDKISYTAAHKQLSDQYSYPIKQLTNFAKQATPTNWAPPLQEAVSIAAKSIGLDLPQPKPMGEAVEEYKEAIRRNPKYKNGLDSTKRRTLDEIVLAFGKDTMTSALTPQLTERYCNLLHCLPKKIQLDRLRSDLWSYMTEKHDGPTIEDGTVRTRLINASDFFNELSRKNLISEKQAKDICRPIRARIQTIESKLTQQKAERPFETEELQKLFNPSTYLNWSCLHAADFWMPILGLFTGARMDELLTLRKKDIKRTPAQPTHSRARDNSREGLWFIDLTDNFKKLKNFASHRVIPIHPHLIELGLLSFLNDFDDDTYLFESHLNKSKTDGSNKLTKEFTAYRRALDIGRAENISEGDRLSFHTFRHTVITTMKHNHVPDSVSREISGHSTGGGKKDAHTHNYEQRHTIEQLYEDGIKVLDCYLKQVPELYALKDSPWTKPASQRGATPKRRPKKKAGKNGL